MTLVLLIGYWFIICLTQLTILKILKKIYKVSHNNVITYLLTIAVGMIIALCIIFIPNLPATYVISFICEAILLSYCFRLTMIQAYLCSCFYVFYMISLNGVVIGLMSLLLKQNSFQILADTNLKYISIILVQVLISCIFTMLSRRIDVKSLRNFLISRKQSVLVLVCHFTLTVYMLFNSFTFYYNLDLVWISIAQVITGLILGIAYIVILNYGVDVADLLQNKLRNQNQLDTIQYQLRQQNSLLRLEEILNQFKHDYREQMLAIEYYVENNYKDKAIDEVHNNLIQQLNTLPQTKKYSNNTIMNSLFIDRQVQCEEQDIKMDVRLFLPPFLGLKEKQCHEVIRILTQNAIDANTKLHDRQRYLKVKSDIDKHWLSVLIENPYEGIVTFENGRPVSRDSKEENEGFGLIYIEELLESSGDVLQYMVDKKERIFKVMMLLHIDNESEEL